MNKTALPLLFTLFLVAVLFSGCTEENSGIANPASVYCEENGGELIIATCGAVGTKSEGWYDLVAGELVQYGLCGQESSQTGFCKKGETLCEEWAFYRGECAL